MGILNVTPDSFSDGGQFPDRDAAVARALAMEEEGADIIDVGGESTRPGARAVSQEEELRRVEPVIEAIREKTGVIISVDTTKAGVARRAVAAGAEIINDVSALTQDPDMLGVARDGKTGIVLMHMLGTPRTMQENPQYGDVVSEVAACMASRVEQAVAAGISKQSIAVDPGIGFGKTLEHNLLLLANLRSMGACGVPVLVGLSRKSFLGKLTGRETGERLAGSIAALTFCVLNGAHIMRVHDVKETVDAIQVALALRDHLPSPVNHQPFPANHSPDHVD